MQVNIIIYGFSEYICHNSGALLRSEKCNVFFFKSKLNVIIKTIELCNDVIYSSYFNKVNRAINIHFPVYDICC